MNTSDPNTQPGSDSEPISDSKVGGIWFPWAEEEWGSGAFWVLQAGSAILALLFGGLGMFILSGLFLAWSPRTRWLVLPVAAVLGLFKYFFLVLPEMSSLGY